MGQGLVIRRKKKEAIVLQFGQTRVLICQGSKGKYLIKAPKGVQISRIPETLTAKCLEGGLIPIYNKETKKYEY